MKATKIILALAILLSMFNTTFAGTLWETETIMGICQSNPDVDKEWNKLYDADFKINNLYFDFWDVEFSKTCNNKNVQITIKWTGKYTFNILKKEIITFDAHDMHTDEKDYFDTNNVLDTIPNDSNKLIEEDDTDVEEAEILKMIIEESNNNINESDEAKFNTILSVEKMSYSEKEEYIRNNKEAVYQELYEILNILNKDVQYYEVDEERSYTETDIFTEKTRMIELYK